jgi:hypothetical protein
LLRHYWQPVALTIELDGPRPAKPESLPARSRRSRSIPLCHPRRGALDQPGSLDALEHSDVLRDSLGEAFVQNFLMIKRSEMERYNSPVTD